MRYKVKTTYEYDTEDTERDSRVLVQVFEQTIIHAPRHLGTDDIRAAFEAAMDSADGVVVTTTINDE